MYHALVRPPPPPRGVGGGGVDIDGVKVFLVQWIHEGTMAMYVGCVYHA